MCQTKEFRFFFFMGNALLTWCEAPFKGKALMYEIQKLLPSGKIIVGN